MSSCPRCGWPSDIPPEPPEGTRVRDRFGGEFVRSGDGWAAPGCLPLARWPAMWATRGPLVLAEFPPTAQEEPPAVTPRTAPLDPDKFVAAAAGLDKLDSVCARAVANELRHIAFLYTTGQLRASQDGWEGH